MDHNISRYYQKWLFFGLGNMLLVYCSGKDDKFSVRETVSALEWIKLCRALADFMVVTSQTVIKVSQRSFSFKSEKSL